MRFASIVEDLGTSIVDSVMTLFAFLPVLAALSVHVTELPLIGHLPEPLLIAAIFWSLFGTVLLAAAGIHLPGLNFRNQRVEAAYRKAHNGSLDGLETMLDERYRRDHTRFAVTPYARAAGAKAPCRAEWVINPSASGARAAFAGNAASAPGTGVPLCAAATSSAMAVG